MMGITSWIFHPITTYASTLGIETLASHNFGEGVEPYFPEPTANIVLLAGSAIRQFRKQPGLVRNCANIALGLAGAYCFFDAYDKWQTAYSLADYSRGIGDAWFAVQAVHSLLKK